VSDAETNTDVPSTSNVIDTVERVHVRPVWAPLTLVAFAGLVICTQIANGGWSRWVESNPELLLTLSSRNRYLAFTLAAGVPVLSYVVIATIRIGIAFIVCHLIGRSYDDVATQIFKRYLGFTDQAEAAFDRGFEKAEWALIPIFSGSNIVAVLSGVRRTPIPKMLLLLAIGIAGRLALMWWLARTFDEQFVDFLEVVARYQVWVLVGSIALVVLVNAKNLRRR
jgi:hypothetical protein